MILDSQLTRLASLQHHHGLRVCHVSMVDLQVFECQPQREDRDMCYDELGDVVRRSTATRALRLSKQADAIQCRHRVSHSRKLEG